jgi:hypothetical protein
MKIKKTVTQKVIDTSRKNAQLSPGHETLAGKNATEPVTKDTKAVDLGVDEILPEDLFRRLRHQEEQLSEEAFRWLQTQFANQRFFTYPLFDPPGDVSDEARESLSDPGVKYNFLLLLLRNSPSSKERLFILATWLYREGICQPEDLLGKDFSEYRRKALGGSRGRLSITDLRQALIVNNWESYFDQLLHGQRTGLGRRGFDECAIQCAISKRSGRAAACEYVCDRLKVDARALENAYSRIFSRVKKTISGPPTQDGRPTS